MTEYHKDPLPQGESLDANNRLDTISATRTHISKYPADLPPTYGLDVSWAWKEVDLSHYQARLRSFRELERDLGKNPHLPITELTGDKWGSVVNALFQAFNLQTSIPQTFGDLENIDRKFGTTTRPEEMARNGLIFEHRQGESRFGDIITNFDEISALPMNQLCIHVPNYMDDARWPLERRNLLGITSENVHYMLLLLKGEISAQFTFKLLPDQPAGLIHPGYYQFYRRLAEMGLPGELDVRGDYSLREVYLGRYNRDHFAIPKIALLPQYDIPSLEAETGKVAEPIRNWKFKSYKRSGMYGDLIDLERQGEPKNCQMQLTEKGGFSITIDRIQYVVIDETKAKAFFSSLLGNGVYDCWKQDILEFCERPEAPYKISLSDFGVIDELRNVMHTEVRNRDTNEVDPTLTARFQRIVSDLESRGAINLNWCAEELRSFYQHLNIEQKDAVSAGVGYYFVDALRRGQLLDNNWIQNIYGLIGETSLSMPPEIGDKLRWLYDNVPAHVVASICGSIDREGYINYHANNFRLNSDAVRKREGLPTSQSEMPEFVKEVDVSYTQYQDKLRARLHEYVQEKVPAAKITDDIIRDIKANGAILLTMHGISTHFDRIEPQLALLVVSLLEYSVGIKLDALRDSMSRESYRVREVLKKLPPPVDVVELNQSTINTQEVKKLTE